MRSLLLGSKESHRFGHESVLFPAYLNSVTSLKSLGERTRFVKLFVRVPDNSNNRVFRQNAYVHLPKETKKQKVAFCSKSGTFDAIKNGVLRVKDPVPQRFIASKHIISSETTFSTTRDVNLTDANLDMHNSAEAS